MKFLIVFVSVLATGVLSVKIRGRILGGNDANTEDFKYQASIFIPSTRNSTLVGECGGAVIHNRWILTVAHCFDGGDRKDTTVALGLNTDNVYTRDIKAIKVIIHQKYFRGKDSILNDIALIKIPHVKYNNYIQRIPLSLLASFDGEMVTVCGWGLTGNSTIDLTKLQYTSLEVLNSTECKQKFGRNIPKTQFCTFSPTSVTCIGDSGNGAVLGYGSNATLAGLLSYGLSNCSANSPDDFTRVFSYLPWIKRKTNKTFRHK